MGTGCTYRQALRAFVSYKRDYIREHQSLPVCIRAEDIADKSGGVCSTKQIRSRMARAEREGLVFSRVMKSEQPRRHRGRRVPLRFKCYNSVSRRRRKALGFISSRRKRR